MKTIRNDNIYTPRIYRYGVYGLTEWQAIITVGNAKIRVPFTGGGLSGFGSTPATFSTESRAMSVIIENSRFFKEGKIVRC